MRIEGHGEVNAHINSNYDWVDRTRIPIPILTSPQVAFHCGARQIHMTAGECWLFDTWKTHNVINNTSQPRIHLVIDTGLSKAQNPICFGTWLFRTA